MMLDDSELEGHLLRSKFERQLFGLRKIILDGISYFIVWQALDREYEDGKQYLHQKKGIWWQYRGFFAPSRNALLWSTLLQLSKAYDKHRGAVSLNNLIASARNNPKELAPYSTQEGLEDIQVKMTKNIESLQRLINYRNKRLAHFDSQVIENIELPPEEINSLVEETKLIFNLLKYASTGEHDDYSDIMGTISEHTSQVIGIMKKSEKLG